MKEYESQKNPPINPILLTLFASSYPNKLYVLIVTYVNTSGNAPLACPASAVDKNLIISE